ncbi:MAG: MoxR family ATPase [Thermoplasmata archaeon]
MDALEMKRLCQMLVTEVEKAIVGKKDVVEKLLACILAEGHVLFEDYPGLAKTLLAKSFAKALGCQFKRIQFVPDLLPADITGGYVFERKSNEFMLRKGPIFTNILLADEINRAPPKTQAALLEAMQERQVTIEGTTYMLENPFVVIATQNPIEYEGTYPLPEAQLDRFIARLSIGYPSKEAEREILARRKARMKEEVDIATVVSHEKLVEMQKYVEHVEIHPDLQNYIVEIVNTTRSDSQVEIGSSPRGSLALQKLACARAAMLGRDFVIPDDVKFMCVEALSHRLILKVEPWIQGVKNEAIVKKVLTEVPVPKVVKRA